MLIKKFSRKGSGDAVSTLIMFIAVMSVTTGLVIAFINYVDITQQSFDSKTELSSNKLRTSISISNVYYDSSNSIVYVYVKNIGETSLVPRLFDLFIDDVFITGFNYTLADNFSQNVTLFQTQESIAIIKDIVLNSGTHDVIVNTEYGVGDKESFNT